MTTRVNGRAISDYKDFDVRETGLAVPRAEPLYVPAISNGYAPDGFIVDDSLLLYLPLYGLKGSKFKTVDRYQLTCEVSDALWQPKGRLFDGDDFISLGSPTHLESLAQKTVILWAKVPAGTGSARTLYYGGYWDNPYGDYIFGRDSDNDIDIRVRNNSGALTFHRVTNSVGVWLMLAYTYNGSKVRYFKNGAYLGGSEDSLTGTIESTAANYNLGRRSSGGGSEYFAGEEGELWIYGKGLPDKAILQTFNVTSWRYQ